MYAMLELRNQLTARDSTVASRLPFSSSGSPKKSGQAECLAADSVRCVETDYWVC